MTFILHAGCDRTTEDVSEVHPSEVTYHGHIRPILETSCVGCHSADGAGPFPLTGWRDVEGIAPLVVQAVIKGRMPPWPAADDCHPLADVRALSEEQKELFTSWSDLGYPEGSEDSYQAPAGRASNVSLGEPDVRLGPTEAYVPNPALTDE